MTATTVEGAPAPGGSARAGAAFVACAALLWGLWPLWVRLGPGGAATATLALLVSGGACFLPALRRAGASRRRSARAWALMGLLGACDAANAWCYFRALAEGAVAPAVLSHYLAPVLLALVAPALLGEPRSRRTPLALALALGGTAALLLVGRDAAGSTPSQAPAAVSHALTLGAASAVFYASTVVLAKRLAPDFSDVEMMGFHNLFAVALLAGVTGLPPARAWLWPVVGALVSALAAGLLYYAGLRRLPAERAGVLAYLEPAAAVLVGWAALGERPTAAAALGGAMILAAGLLVVTTPAPAAAPAPSAATR